MRQKCCLTVNNEKPWISHFKSTHFSTVISHNLSLSKSSLARISINYGCTKKFQEAFLYRKSYNIGFIPLIMRVSWLSSLLCTDWLLINTFNIMHETSRSQIFAPQVWAHWVSWIQWKRSFLLSFCGKKCWWHFSNKKLHIITKIQSVSKVLMI